MLDKWRGGMRLVFWCVMLVEAGLDSEYGVGGKGDAHNRLGANVGKDDPHREALKTD